MKVIAAVYHFAPSEIWEMDADELTMWKDNANELIDGMS